MANLALTQVQAAGGLTLHEQFDFRSDHDIAQAQMQQAQAQVLSARPR